MARTYRKVNPKYLQSTKRHMREMEQGLWGNYKQSDVAKRRDAAVLRGDDGILPIDKSTEATVDRVGNYKLNRWSGWIYSKRQTNRPQRQQRIANQILIKYGLQDYYFSLEDDETAYLEEMQAIEDDWIMDEYYDSLEHQEDYYDYEEETDDWYDDSWDDPWDDY